MAEEQSKPKLSRKLLWWALPGLIAPMFLWVVVSKGIDLGQAEKDAEILEKQQAAREQLLNDRVLNPEEAAKEDVRRAQEKQRDSLPSPPPPGNASGSAGGPSLEELSAKSNDVRAQSLIDAHNIIGDSLSDAERQSVLENPARKEDDERKRFVVYTAPAKEGVVSGATNAAAEAVTIKTEEKEKAADKPFLSVNDDKVSTASTTIAQRVDGLYWIAPGTIVRAVLLNAVDTRIPGQVTARVTEPVYDSRYGRYLVIPAGSTLIGQYDSAIGNGQHRVMMAFRSLVTPSGGVVDLSGVRASDALGRLGIEGELHTYFWRRMGVAALLAVESVAMDRLAERQTAISTSGSTSTTTNTSEAAKIISEAAKQEPWLKPIPPNITIEEGQKITVVTVASIEVPPSANKR